MLENEPGQEVRRQDVNPKKGIKNNNVLQEKR